MTTQDIMVGDWVKIAYIKEDGTPVSKTFQVSEIQGKYAWSAKGGNMGDKLYPIELMPEILEKNGFKREAQGLWSFNDGFSINDTFVLGEVINNGQLIFKCSPFRVRYIHELQHALHLCGLQELANNFKI